MISTNYVSVDWSTWTPLPRRNGTEPRPALSPVEQVVVAVVLTALLARLWRWW
ncbi:MAG: hypothetical protein IIC82_09320 [Chloroflexi bacterium]|nr:hypothetical protein [Chloroflexota bacterium]